MRKITIIAAMNNLCYIGKDNSLMWHQPSDLKFFKESTLGKVVVMGRKTYESLPMKPLNNRENVVVSRTAKLKLPGVKIINSVHDFVINTNEDLFIIGGSEIYKAFEEYATDMVLTIINNNDVGDTIFPLLDSGLWEKQHQVEVVKYGLDKYESIRIYFKKKTNGK